MNQIAENFFCFKRELNCVARQLKEQIEIYKCSYNLSPRIDNIKSNIICRRPLTACENFTFMYIKKYIHLRVFIRFSIKCYTYL